MSLFVWQPQYSVNDPLVDDQHARVFQAANAVHATLTHGSGREAVGRALAALVESILDHFGAEEELMRTTQYPPYAPHKAEHEYFARRAVALQREFLDGSAVLTIETLVFLRDWLEQHILGSDILIGSHIAARHIASR